LHRERIVLDGAARTVATRCSAIGSVDCAAARGRGCSGRRLGELDNLNEVGGVVACERPCITITTAITITLINVTATAAATNLSNGTNTITAICAASVTKCSVTVIN